MTDTTCPQPVALEDELPSALARGELVLLYQPIVALSTGRIVGAEALLRWQHPTLGILTPDAFLAFAEDLELASAIGEWTLRSACREAKRWRDGGANGGVVSVNVSAAQFRDDGFVARIEDALAACDLNAGLLEIELTENIVMHDAEMFVAKLNALKRVGVQLALDDFGTGYSNFNYLKRFPLDTLKIDRSFIRDVTTNPDDAAIVRAVLSVGHSLGLDLVAEGVETHAQVAWLHRERCEKIQGYFLGRPLDADAFAALLRDGRQIVTTSQPTEARRRTLLIVDDERNILASVVRLLRRDDYRVLTANSAQEAFDVLAKNDVQVVLSDHRMPVMTGAEFLAKVKGLYPDTVRLLFSGHVEIEALTDAVNRGAVYRFLLKPWNDDALRASVRDAFEHYWLTHRVCE